jgi:N-succinyldiaminopimelate aminotransferase
MAGNRVGYLVGPQDVIGEARKISTHTFYAAPTAGQLAALRALRDGAAWVEAAKQLYREAGRHAAAQLGQPAPSGSTFLFLDVSQRLDARGVSGFLEDCFEDGVLVAPGGSSGQAYSEWVRVCYTAAPPEQVREAVTRLAKRVR